MKIVVADDFGIYVGKLRKQGMSRETAWGR